MKHKVLGVDMEYFTAIEKDSQFKGFSLIQISTYECVYLIDSI